MLQMLIAWLTLSILGGLGEENVLGIRQSDADGCSGDSHEQQVVVWTVQMMLLHQFWWLVNLVSVSFHISDMNHKQAQIKHSSHCFNCQWLPVVS